MGYASAMAFGGTRSLLVAAQSSSLSAGTDRMEEGEGAGFNSGVEGYTCIFVEMPTISPGGCKCRGLSD